MSSRDTVLSPFSQAIELRRNQTEVGDFGVALPGAEGEFPRAFVVRRPGGEGLKLDERAVREYMESRLAKYKALTGGVKFVDAIAKNASGKILKRLLREQSRSDLGVSAKI